MILCIGCIEGSTDNDYGYDKPFTHSVVPQQPQSPSDSIEIIKQANSLKNACGDEVEATNDLYSMVVVNGRISDEGDIWLLINQRQKQDIVCQGFIDYAEANKYVLDNEVTEKGWATRMIRIYTLNKESNEIWYVEIEDYLNIEIARPDLSSPKIYDDADNEDYPVTPPNTDPYPNTDPESDTKEWWEFNTFHGDWSITSIAHNIPTCEAMLQQVAYEQQNICNPYKPSIIRGHMQTTKRTCMLAYEGSPYVDANQREQLISTLEYSFNEYDRVMSYVTDDMCQYY